MSMLFLFLSVKAWLPPEDHRVSWGAKEQNGAGGTKKSLQMNNQSTGPYLERHMFFAEYLYIFFSIGWIWPKRVKMHDDACFF